MMVKFCGSHANITPLGHHGNWSIVPEVGVLENECFLNTLRMLPHILLILFALPVIILLGHSQSRQSQARTWVYFPHHNVRWVLTLTLLVLTLCQLLEGVFSSNLDDLGPRLYLFVPFGVSFVGGIVSITYYHNIELWNSSKFLLPLVPYWLASLAIETLRMLCMNKLGMGEQHLRMHLARVGIVVFGGLALLEADVWRQLVRLFSKYLLQSKITKKLNNFKYRQYSQHSLPKYSYSSPKSVSNHNSLPWLPATDP